MPRIYIGIGSNIEAEKNIRIAVAALRQHYGDLLISTVYESAAVGFSGNNFLNLVIGCDTQEDVHQVAEKLHEIENAHGRDRSAPKFSSRTLDLDILLYDDLIIDEPGLQLPREEITENAFVLWPLAELAPDYKHPVLGTTLAELWAAYARDKQKIWPVEFQW